MIKDILARIRRDWKEFWWHKFAMWDQSRDTKRILNAIEMAKLKNKADGRKYLVLRDPRGMPGAYNMQDIRWLENQGILPRLNHVERDKHALAIVSSDKKTQEQYVAIQTKKEE